MKGITDYERAHSDNSTEPTGVDWDEYGRATFTSAKGCRITVAAYPDEQPAWRKYREGLQLSVDFGANSASGFSREQVRDVLIPLLQRFAHTGKLTASTPADTTESREGQGNG